MRLSLRFIIPLLLALAAWRRMVPPWTADAAMVGWISTSGQLSPQAHFHCRAHPTREIGEDRHVFTRSRRRSVCSRGICASAKVRRSQPALPSQIYARLDPRQAEVAIQRAGPLLVPQGLDVTGNRLQDRDRDDLSFVATQWVKREQYLFYFLSYSAPLFPHHRRHRPVELAGVDARIGRRFFAAKGSGFSPTFRSPEVAPRERPAALVRDLNRASRALTMPRCGTPDVTWHFHDESASTK